jgi:3-phosphoshikimate 1-carboxyvinyltransferase
MSALSATTGDLVVVPAAARLRGTIRVPPDKSITHRALLLGALAAGRSRIADGSDGLDPRSTASCLRALGVPVERVEREDPEPGEGGRVDWLVGRADWPGWAGWVEPHEALDCGNSGTTLRLLAGILAGLPLAAALDGDDSLRRRPVARMIEPLRAMGARLSARSGDSLPPLVVAGRRPLTPIEHTMAIPSAQVKSAVLLAGLAAEGVTTVHEPVATRDHTERMLSARGVSVRVRDGDGGSRSVSVEGGASVQAIDERVPGDASAACFWLVCGAAHADAALTLEAVGVNPTRRAAIDLLRRMGARIDEQPLGSGSDTGEPVADLVVESSSLRAIEIAPTEVAQAIDEIPALALAAAFARGTTRIRGAAELRRKESDRLAGIATGLSALGAGIRVDGDDLVVEGGGDRLHGGLRGAQVDSLDDHRLAMTFAVAGLLAAGETTIDGAGSVAVSYPSFFSDLERVRA